MAHTIKAADLKTGNEIQFFAVPYGSYASVLTKYRVEVTNPKSSPRKGSDSLRLVNVATGSSTYDTLSAFRGASFEVL